MRSRLLFIVFISLLHSVLAQNITDDTQDFRVGVVLSGGGAKGLSHIGVLKELEKNGVRIDYIGGTSMGAIVGALYAVGYSPDEMLELIETVDFEAVLSDDVERKYKSLFDKENGEKYALTLPIQDKKIGIPLSLSRGQGVLNLLTKLLEPVDSIQDFSELPIPFYCIGTEVASGDIKVFESGSLPLAVRASASFPTFFQPVEIDNKLYIDGGIVSNFPVKVMRSKGVDVIIGSDVQSELLKTEDVNSIVDLLDQIISYGMYEKSDQERELVDIYIHPDIDSYSTFTFDDPKEIIEKGSEEASKNSVAFKKLAEIQGSLNPINRKRVVLENKRVQISDIKIEGNENYTKDYLLKKIGIKVGDYITYDEINQRMQAVTYQGTIERLSYKMVRREDQKWILEIELKESKTHVFFRLGAHYDPLYRTGVLLNFTDYNFIQKNDVLSVDLVVGDNLRYNFDYFVDYGRFFGYGFSAKHNGFKSLVSSELEGYPFVNMDLEDYKERIYIEAFYKNFITLGAGIEHNFLKLSTATLPPQEGEKEYLIDKSHYFNLVGYLKSDSFDRVVYPNYGTYINAEFKWVLNSSDYNANFTPFSQISLDYSFAHSFFKDRITTQLSLSGGLTMGSAQWYFNYFLGSYGENYINNFFKLYGYDFASLNGNSFAKLTLDSRFQLFKNNYLVFGANVAKVGDNIYSSPGFTKRLNFGMAAGYSLRSPIGPIDLKYGWSPRSKSSQWYFDLGFWF